MHFAFDIQEFVPTLTKSLISQEDLMTCAWCWCQHYGNVLSTDSTSIHVFTS